MGMSYEYCIEKGLIVKNNESKDWVNKELDIAKRFLGQSIIILKTKAFESTEMIAYTSVFHSARALLYSYGYAEKSHYCVFIMLMHISKGDTNLVNELKTANCLRSGRHDTIYGGKTVNEKEANFSVEFAGKFMKLIKSKIMK